MEIYKPLTVRYCGTKPFRDFPFRKLFKYFLPFDRIFFKTCKLNEN